MKIGRLADNLVATATQLTTDSAFTLGHPASLLYDADPFAYAQWRNMWVIDSASNAYYNKIDFDDGAVKAATLTDGTFVGAERAIMVRDRLNAVGSGFSVYQYQGSTNRHRWRIDCSGGCSLLVASGVNASAAAPLYLMGFRNEDRASATSHTGDFAAVTPIDPNIGDMVVYDLGASSNLGGTGAFIANLIASPDARPLFGISTLSTRFSWFPFGDAADCRIQFANFADQAQPFRYFAFAPGDPKRETSQCAGLGYLYYGRIFDTGPAVFFDPVDWEVSTYQHGFEQRARIQRGTYGQLFAEGVRPAETFGVAFQQSPGIGPNELPAYEEMAAALGMEGLAFVSFDSTVDKNRHTRLCRISAAPAFAQAAVQSRLGRTAVALLCEALEVN